jgi:hypothetical protein
MTEDDSKALLAKLEIAVVRDGIETGIIEAEMAC